MGDMESCQKVAGGEYLLVQISGDVYNTEMFSKGGKGYFFPKMTSLMGICVPKLCTLEELELLKPYFYKQGRLYGFMNETLKIDFNLQKQISTTDLQRIGPYFTFVFLAMLVIFILICFGTIIELT